MPPRPEPRAPPPRPPRAGPPNADDEVGGEDEEVEAACELWSADAANECEDDEDGADDDVEIAALSTEMTRNEVADGNEGKDG